jgi:hypothetical protein
MRDCNEYSFVNVSFAGVVLSIKSYGDVYATGENLVAPGRI